MRRVGLIISYNKRINENLRIGNTELAAKWYYAGPEHKHEAQKPETLTF